MRFHGYLMGAFTDTAPKSNANGWFVAGVAAKKLAI